MLEEVVTTAEVDAGRPNVKRKRSLTSLIIVRDLSSARSSRFLTSLPRRISRSSCGTSCVQPSRPVLVLDISQFLEFLSGPSVLFVLHIACSHVPRQLRIFLAYSRLIKRTCIYSCCLTPSSSLDILDLSSRL